MSYHLQFPRRAIVRQTETSVLRRYAAADGPFVVVECQSLLGLPRRYLAVQRMPNGNECVLSRHRTKRAAARACETVFRSWPR